MLTNAGAEDAVKQILIECVGPALDKNLFSTNAAVPQLKPAAYLTASRLSRPAPLVELKQCSKTWKHSAPPFRKSQAKALSLS
jgi:hypothetical protein